MKRPLPAKPGAQRAPFRPDVVLDFDVPALGPSDAAEASPEQEPASVRLLDFLAASMPQAKRTSLKAYLKYGQVAVNTVPVSQFDRALQPGDRVSVNTTRPFQTLANPRLRLVHQDDDILVVNKGYGLLSVASDTKRDGTAYSILRDYLKHLDPRNKVFIVHRLDQQTSGLMMFARSEKAKETMQHNWNNMVLQRHYYAVVEGTVEPDEGVVRSYLAENAAHEVYSTKDPQKGKLAVTRYRVIQRGQGRTLLELSLDTGRKNQIRVHMKDLGHPIVGDRRYGAQGPSPIHRLALHAGTLRFVHPSTRRDMNFSTPIPRDFQSLVR